MRKLRQVLFATAVAMSSVVFASDTWYWQSITKCTGQYEYGYSLTSADNWVNAATGLNGVPLSGDIVVIDRNLYSEALAKPPAPQRLTACARAFL